MKIPDLDQFINIQHHLPAVGTWRSSVHVFDERTAQAIRAALASGRPLLVRGEPGTGKSQLARAAAKVLGRKFLAQVIDAHTEIQDLWYRFDAVSRLGNAQVLSATGKDKSEKEIESILDPQRYLSPGILWWAFAWEKAEQHGCHHPQFKPDENVPGDVGQGVVLLLDEIDKADADLPNSLLETLDNGKFTVPWIQGAVGVDATNTTPRPLVVITTNEDRQLPGAFVRRCLVLDLSLPDDTETNLTEFLKDRAAFHFPSQNTKAELNARVERDSKGKFLGASRFDEDVLNEVAKQLFQDRQQARSFGVTPPGQAEYLDILRVLDQLVPNDSQQQKELLKTIQPFALQKYPNMQKPEREKTVTETNITPSADE
ncbi:MAG: MoxR family ATPase [Methylococcaceae bacterium]|nr:MoxR family ATPase [Methylococcaceae bacterium]